MSARNYTNQPPVSVFVDENSMDGLIDVYQQGESALNHLPESKKQLLLGLVNFIVESGCEQNDELGMISKPTLLTVVPAMECSNLVKHPKVSANDGGY